MRVEVKFGRALQKLKGWSPERIEALKRQLANDELALMRSSMPDIPASNDQERKAVADSIQETAAHNLEQLRESMGDPDFTVFETAQKIEPYRDYMASVVNAMRANSIEVNGDMEESMLSAYASAVEQAAKQAGSVDFSNLDESQQAQLKSLQNQAFQSILVKQLSAILSEDQVRAFMIASAEHR